MTTPCPKRRRLNAPSALHKPFKSPFRTPLQRNPHPPETPPSSDGPEPPTHPSAASSFSQTTPQLQPKQQTSTPLASPQRRRPAETHVRTPYSASATTQISALRAQIHTLEQATQLLQNPASDAALEDLIAKWRTASRAAAEELYATSRDRVNRMGGVGAWRDREKDQKRKVLEWEEDALCAEEGNSDEDEEDDDEEEDEEGRKVSAEEKEMRREAKKEARREAKKEARRAAKEMKKWQLEQLQEKKRMMEERTDEGGKLHDDDSFTMDMMLKALSIELEVIGYSRELQQWVG